jgi:capsular polysaccharide biosynthesis protein
MTSDVDSPRRTRRRLPTLLIVVATVLAVLSAFAAYAVTKNHKPSFRSQGAVTFDQPAKLAASTNAGVIDKLSRLRAKYIGLARSDNVIDAVAKEVSLTRQQVAPRLFTAADRNSLLLIVGARANKAQTARRIATAFANEIVVAVEQQQVKDKIADKDRFLASVVIQPRASVLISPTKRKSVTSGVVAGLLVFLAVLGIGSLIRRPTR